MCGTSPGRVIQRPNRKIRSSCDKEAHVRRVTHDLHAIKDEERLSRRMVIATSPIRDRLETKTASEATIESVVRGLHYAQPGDDIKGHI
jgi:hypothetical protein